MADGGCADVQGGLSVTTSVSLLFDEVSARLPLFEDFPEGAPERLAAAGLGRGLLTAAVRGRLRKAGFTDMGVLALATPAELTKVRKIGPVRLLAIRAHVLDELARIYPDARAFHALDATASRRMDRLRTMPAGRLPLKGAAFEELGRAGESCATVAMRGRNECLKTPAIAAGDLDAVVVTLARFLLQDRPRVAPTIEADPAGTEVRIRDERARMLRERDREWEEAAPNERSRRF